MTYTFKVLVEPDGERWYACCPALVAQGAATWGYTREEALRNIQDVVRMVVDSLLEHGETLPSASSPDVQVSAEPQVAVSLRRGCSARNDSRGRLSERTAAHRRPANPARDQLHNYDT